MKSENNNWLLIGLPGRWCYSNEGKGTHREGVIDADSFFNTEGEVKENRKGCEMGQVRGCAGQFGDTLGGQGCPERLQSVVVTEVLRDGKHSRISAGGLIEEG